MGVPSYPHLGPLCPRLGAGGDCKDESDEGGECSCEDCDDVGCGGSLCNCCSDATSGGGWNSCGGASCGSCEVGSSVGDVNCSCVWVEHTRLLYSSGIKADGVVSVPEMRKYEIRLQVE